MADEWYYRMFGHDFGPVGFDELKELAELGSISSGDEVRLSTSSNWVSADSVNELGLSAVNSASPNQPDAKPSPAPITHDWFCKIDGQELGPLTFNELVEFAERGLFHPNDEVKLGVTGKWRRVGSIGRLVAVLPFLQQQISVPIRPEKTNSQSATPTPISAVPANAPLPSKPNPATMAANTVAANNGGAQAQTASKGADGTAKIATPIEAIKPTPSPVQANPVVSPSNPGVVAATVTKSVESVVSPSTSPVASNPTPYSYSSSSSFASSSPRPSSPPARPPARTSQSSSGGIAPIVDMIMDPKILGGVVVVALLVVGFFFLPKGYGKDIERYRELKKLLEDVRAERSGSKSFEPLIARAKTLSTEIPAALNADANADNPAKQALLWGARDELPKMMGGDLSTESGFEKNLELRLKDAAKIMGLE